MPSKRILRGLATAAPAPASRTNTTLLPPYSHSTAKPNPSSSLRPPYAHSTSGQPSVPSGSLAAPYKFSLLPPSRTAYAAKEVEVWNAWAKDLIKTEQGRERVWSLWVGSIIELEKVKSLGNQVPQVSFHSLSAQLKDGAALESMRSVGSLVVRDVVADAEATEWAQSLFQALSLRDARPVFWHDAQLAARSHTSVLSAISQLATAFTGQAGPSYIQADAAQVGIASPGARTTSLADPWQVDENAPSPNTPLLSHLALTASSAGPTQISPSIHAAIYSSLRPLFQPAKSLISFYDKSAYLDPANWELVSSLPDYPPSETPSFPHLEGATVPLPALQPGDMVFRNAAIPVPVDAEDAQIFLPTSPLPSVQGNVEYVAQQREAYEQGLPPPHAKGDGLIALEQGGTANRISSSGGRRAMGYE